MHVTRVSRLLACLSALVVAAWGSAAPAKAELPAGNITLVVPLAAGGPTDGLARIVADKLGPMLQRTVVVENRGGAGGNIGGAAVARAEPNGLTLLFTIDSLLTINPHLYPSQGFDADKDLTPVSIVGQFTLMMCVNAKVPAKTWSELVAYSKTKSVNFGSAGFGTPPHLALEYLKSVSKLDAAHVSFRGAAPALTELLAGNVEGSFLVAGAVIEHVKNGTLRALAVSSPERLPIMPDVPTASEVGIPGFEARFTNMLMVPSATPLSVQQRLSQAVAEIVRQPEVRERFAALATDPVGSTPQEAAARVAQERARWGKVIKDADIKLPR